MQQYPVNFGSYNFAVAFSAEPWSKYSTTEDINNPTNNRLVQ
jgi:hypothetical protein